MKTVLKEDKSNKFKPFTIELTFESFVEPRTLYYYTRIAPEESLRELNSILLKKTREEMK